MKQNLVINIGETFVLNLEYTNPDGSPIDLTGFKASFLVRSAGQPDSKVLAAATTENGGVVIDGANITIKFTDEQTTAFKWNKAAYKVVIESPNGDKTRLLQGLVIPDFGAVA